MVFEHLNYKKLPHVRSDAAKKRYKVVIWLLRLFVVFLLLVVCWLIYPTMCLTETWLDILTGVGLVGVGLTVVGVIRLRSSSSTQLKWLNLGILLLWLRFSYTTGEFAYKVNLGVLAIWIWFRKNTEAYFNQVGIYFSHHMIDASVSLDASFFVTLLLIVVTMFTLYVNSFEHKFTKENETGTGKGNDTVTRNDTEE